jgi:hypothetical protein
MLKNSDLWVGGVFSPNIPYKRIYCFAVRIERFYPDEERTNSQIHFKVPFIRVLRPQFKNLLEMPKGVGVDNPRLKE